MFSRRDRMSKASGHGINKDLADAVRTLRSLVDPYRPELHYMRGPGPKWHAKHRPATAEAPTLPGLARLKG